MGKTRSVFEALQAHPNQRELVLYTNDEQAAIAIATALTNEPDANAILVADECLIGTRFQLEELLRGAEGRVRLITIDNARGRTRSLSPELKISRTSEAEMLSILDANFAQHPLRPEAQIRFNFRWLPPVGYFDVFQRCRNTTER